MTEKQKKRIDELANKALNGGLEKKEIDELHSLLKKSKEEQDKEKSSREKLSEKITIVLAEEALKVAQRKYHESLPLKERAKMLNKKFDEANKFFERATKELEAEADRLKKKREEREFYEKHAKKYGKTL
ncbi:hypothetical protein [Anoxybacteroides rupiense]|jgi:hypothetical protein|uniref:hypothetical protein n=1 Tax=Anoxybacteroides rupiense TaxID=311460 RepID=UPI0016060124|nr:hypothetical protein [Anoxybacillus rupiensis]MBB3908486.1 DNA repair ATPase RecN [Anoxybacillus rupiensis]